MKAQPQSASGFTPPSVPMNPADTRTPEQKAQAKALKKERKYERMRFFFAWCEGCRAFGCGF
ncbi:hypothetical protein GCM10022409_45650 [Hymenobacter glaciei]|uniref:Uncharacterized protein n=1 Tax=Hymenobacter glaciei TaxID=877209 RepID=A0ABP7UUW9_9BACT